MQLISLKIFKDETILREIFFKEGLNIITNSEDDGNQIGKSTSLRIINFCLGSDGKNIWHDPESRTENKQIKLLITSGRITFQLEMIIRGIKYIIKRCIHEIIQKRRTIFKITSYINENRFDTNDNFKNALAPILGLSTTNPTYSSIKNRLVRLDKKTASNIYRYLHPNTTLQQYTLYYSYLFGFSGHADLISEIKDSEEISKKRNRISTLLNGHKEQDFKDKLKSIDDDIDNLKEYENAYDFKEVQNSSVLQLRNLRKEISQMTSEITNLDIRVSYSQKTIEGYKNKETNINATQIDKIYQEAGLLLPHLSKKLDELINFHNQVLVKKVEYLSSKIFAYQATIKKLKNRLNSLLDKEKELLSSLISESHLSGFFLIEKEIQNLREERGRVSVIIDEVQLESEEIVSLENKITELREKNKKQLSQLEINIETFNKYLKEYTRAIFKDFSLSLNVSTKSGTNEIEFSIVNEDKVSGDGAPRAAALAFDIALVAYIKETQSRLPQFTIQDYLEASDQEKLATLARMANENKIQVIISVLKDKLASLSPDFIASNTVLSLKKSDKFFKID